MEQKIFVMVVWISLSLLFVIVPFQRRFNKLVFLSLGKTKSSLQFETRQTQKKSTTMGVVLESDSEDDEKDLRRKKKEESSDSEVFIYLFLVLVLVICRVVVVVVVVVVVFGVVVQSASLGDDF
jgi:hypothetical protein